MSFNESSIINFHLLKLDLKIYLLQNMHYLPTSAQMPVRIWVLDARFYALRPDSFALISEKIHWADGQCSVKLSTLTNEGHFCYINCAGKTHMSASESGFKPICYNSLVSTH